MPNVFVSFQRHSGQILSVQHGNLHPDRARQRALQLAANRLHSHAVSSDDVDMISVPSDSLDRGKRYKVDLSRQALVETAKGGVAFAAGSSGIIPR